MKAVQRPGEGYIVHWCLRPITSLMEPARPGWLTAKGLGLGIDGMREEFDLPTAHPWFLESRRALQQMNRFNASEGGSIIAPPAWF